MSRPTKQILDLHSGGNPRMSFFDEFNEKGKRIMLPSTSVPALRYSFYVRGPLVAKRYAQRLRDELQIAKINVYFVEPHQVWYGKSAGAWKVHAFFPTGNS